MNGSIGLTTLADMWRRSVDERPAATFLRFEAPNGAITEWSYASFDAEVQRVAARLHALGVDDQRGVHLALTNSPHFVALWLAASAIGSYLVPSDPMGTAPELAEHLVRTAPAVGVCATSRADIYRAACAESGLRDLSVVEVDESQSQLGVLGGDGPIPPVTPSGSARAAVMFTSGTTGRPKGVIITQANYAFAGATMAAACDLQPNDRQLVVLPLFHANAQYYSFAAAIAVGASVALVHTFSASRFVEQAARHGATHASLFAGPMRMILARGGPLDRSSGLPRLQLRHCWYAQNLADDQYATLTEWLGCRPRQLYGMTETIPAVLTDAADDPRPDTMGYVTDGCVVDVQRADGSSCASNEIGEIVVGGVPGDTLFGGYLDDEHTTNASYRDGWFLTGDRAWREADGRHHFDGRRSDVLKVSGENVSVVEVEAALTEHPAVFEAVVVGAPDPVRDEVPVAFVVASPDAPTDPDVLTTLLAEWSTERMAKAKRPARFVIVDELPRTSVGKIRKFLLTEAALEPSVPSASAPSSVSPTSPPPASPSSPEAVS
ncbi:MAG: AMP-binding protein [Actinomycetota bacterium]